ncbi:MAG: RT0821/Lpp0805 family surface protein [Candidatus Tectomicrobia bacterium]|nr:RT0821/Lpp0805 family surface protein [Candidatus Tectomicrobia bacterium]
MTATAKRLYVLIVLTAFLLAACETTGPKATVGGLGGAAAGGLLGAVLGGGGEGIAAGAILGGLLGSAVGDRLDAADRQYASQTAYRALETAPSGTSLPWRNPDSGHSGRVTPTRTYQTARGTYCREYQQTVMVGGRSQQAYGTACRQPDGSWKITN